MDDVRDIDATRTWIPYAIKATRHGGRLRAYTSHKKSHLPAASMPLSYIALTTGCATGAQPTGAWVLNFTTSA